LFSETNTFYFRAGANDDIMAGQSTFMVELMETSNILRGATADSLVILDELGRGTSTFDGYDISTQLEIGFSNTEYRYSIAYGVLSHLADTLKCRTIFSTHYHMLTNEFVNHPKVALHHMACSIDNERQRVVYLYTLGMFNMFLAQGIHFSIWFATASGACEKSHGMNVALVAGIPEYVTDIGNSKTSF